MGAAQNKNRLKHWKATMSDKIEELFSLHTETKLMRNGRVEIHCKRGFWGVSAASEDEAMREAKHYFVQYFEDGEYD